MRCPAQKARKSSSRSLRVRSRLIVGARAVAGELRLPDGAAEEVRSTACRARCRRSCARAWSRGCRGGWVIVAATIERAGSDEGECPSVELDRTSRRRETSIGPSSGRPQKPPQRRRAHVTQDGSRPRRRAPLPSTAPRCSTSGGRPRRRPDAGGATAPPRTRQRDRGPPQVPHRASCAMRDHPMLPSGDTAISRVGAGGVLLP